MTSEDSARLSNELVRDVMEPSAQEWERLARAVEIKARCELLRPDLVEDIVQETLGRAHKALADGHLLDRSRLGAFVAGIAHNVIVDVMRHEARACLVPVDVDSADSSIPSTARDPLEIVVADEDKMEVRAALRRLSESDRELLQLVYFEGLQPHEIALRRAEPAERIRKRLSRALLRLRVIFLRVAPRRSRSGVQTDYMESPTDRPELERGSGR